jgi:hypothetical protein
MEQQIDDLIKSLGALRPLVGEFGRIDGRMEAGRAALATVNGQLDKVRQELATLRDQQGGERHLWSKEQEDMTLKRQIAERDLEEDLAHQRRELTRTQNALARGRKEVEELAQEYRRERWRLGI